MMWTESGEQRATHSSTQSSTGLGSMAQSPLLNDIERLIFTMFRTKVSY